MMKNNLLCLVYCGLMFSASYGFAQEPLTTEVSRQVEQIAAGIDKTPEEAAKSSTDS